jgi:ABC-type transport system substrate-binding protein
MARIRIIALLAATLLAGCAPRPAISNPAARQTAVAAAPTRTPRPGETPVALPPTAIATPNLPTATPFATPRPEAGIFQDDAIGFRVDYPFFWNRSSAAVPGTIVQLANQPDTVFVLILRTPLDKGKDLQAAAAVVQPQIAEWLGGLDQQSSGPAKSPAGVLSWRGDYSRTYAAYGVTIRSLMASVANGRQLITLAAYAKAQDLGQERETLAKIFDSVRLAEPKVYGIPRRQAYIFSGSEARGPRAADPATGRGDHLVFSGLVGLDPQLGLRADLAAGWQISPDGTVYTFYLRRDARFHDGRPLTAGDVIYSWDRAASPQLGSDIALTYLGDIVGAAERRSGAAKVIAGLRAIDDYTLEVTIDAPKPYFLLKLTASPALVLDRANVQSGADWYRHPNGSGPYRLIRWDPSKVKIYERSAGYYGAAPPTRYLIARLDLGAGGIYPYLLDEVDQINLSGYERNILRDLDPQLSADLREVPQMCTAFVSLDTSKPPFDDPKVRQAFALAVNHQRYQERALGGGGILAHGLYPPGMPGYSPDFAGMPFDPALARQRLAESSYGGSEKLPEIVLTSSGYGQSIDPGVGVLVQMWQESLGANIKIEQLEPQGYAETMQSGGRGNLFFREWCADYPDPENFAEALFGSGAPQNIGGYHNPDLDGLLRQASVAADPAQRIGLYQQAEALIVQDGAAIFLNHRVDAMLVAPRVKGIVRAPIDLPVESSLQLGAEP